MPHNDPNNPNSDNTPANNSTPSKPAPFLQQKGNYRGLIVYQKTECIYDITYYFARTYLAKGDRTVDQMIQAARSGKQNIAEGAVAATTSCETELKLLNVARASLQELLIDYEDYLRVRGKVRWSTDSPQYRQARRVCSTHNDAAYYSHAITERSPDTIANIAITLIHQADALLNALLKKLQEQFLQNGGIREQMTKARIDYRNNNKQQ